MQPDTRARIFGMAIALLALAGLALRYGLCVSAARAAGGSAWRVTADFFSYFSILANLLVVVVFMAPGGFLRGPRARAGVTLYIVLVGLVYELMLRRLWHLEGIQFLASLILHDVVPVSVLAHWLVFRRKGALRWPHAFAWLGFPMAYLAYVLLRGASTGWWAYPFIDASGLGYVRAMINAIGLVALLAGLGLALVAWDRLGSSAPSRAPEWRESLAPPDDETLPEMSGA